MRAVCLNPSLAPAKAPRLPRPALAWWAPATRLLALWALACSAQATVVTSTDWLVDWNQQRRTAGGALVDVPGSVSGSSSGASTTLNPTLPDGASIDGRATLSFDRDTAQLRSSTRVSGRIRAPGSDLSWDRLMLHSENTMTINDDLSTLHDGFGFVKFTLRVTGNLLMTSEIVAPPSAFSIVDQVSTATGDARVVGGESTSFSVRLQDNMAGAMDDKFSINETGSIDTLLDVIVPWEEGQPIYFNFTYRELAHFSMRYFDTYEVNFSHENDISRTVQIYADVYDAAGNWLPDANLISGSGIHYASWAATVTPGALPEPSTLALAACSAAWLFRRRRPA